MTTPTRFGAPTTDELYARRDAAQGRLEAILDKVRDEKRSALTPLEDQSFNAIAEEIRSIDDRVSELRESASRRAHAAEARRISGSTGRQSWSVSEPDMYVPDGTNGVSYFRDLASAMLRNDASAQDRLRRNSVSQEQRAIGNTGAVGGSGGEFAPPGWAVDEWVNLIRPGRITADLFDKKPIPPGVSSMNYPKILTGTTTAIQTTQNTSLSNTDLTTTFVQTGFATIGGKQVVSQQLLDQSALNLDLVILKDLAADYGQRVGTQIFLGTGTGSGTGSVVNGLQNATAGSTQVWTQASPTPAGFYGQCGALLSKFMTARQAAPTCWVMAPRRWFWMESATDTAGRPLVVPNGPAFNQIATQSGVPVAAGMIGTMHGLPVYIDPLVPTNLGTGSNQDIVYLLKSDDLVLFESQPNAEVFRETMADSASVLFRMFAYIGTILNRHTESIGALSGTGLVTPTFAS